MLEIRKTIPENQTFPGSLQAFINKAGILSFPVRNYLNLLKSNLSFRAGRCRCIFCNAAQDSKPYSFPRANKCHNC